MEQKIQYSRIAMITHIRRGVHYSRGVCLKRIKSLSVASFDIIQYIIKRHNTGCNYHYDVKVWDWSWVEFTEPLILLNLTFVQSLCDTTEVAVGRRQYSMPSDYCFGCAMSNFFLLLASDQPSTTKGAQEWERSSAVGTGSFKAESWNSKLFISFLINSK